MNKTQIAVFGGGCFWCTEAVFQRLKGVKSVTPGYAGGNENYGTPETSSGVGKTGPSYESVSSGLTGHAEVIQVEFDPAQIPYEALLEVFFATHDPTTPDRQGNDRGTQYRSIVLAADAAQQAAAEKMIAKLQPEYRDLIVTQVEKLGEFYPAEDYHMNYYNENKGQPYCSLIISPKLGKLREKYGERMK